MSTPPPYRPPTIRHDDGEEPPPAYTEAQRRTSLALQASRPPDYERLTAALQNRPKFATELPPNAATYTLPAQPGPSTSTYRESRADFEPSSSSSTAPLPNNSRKSTWQKLKEENAARKAKTQHVTHAQAAALLGHGEEWERERRGWSTGREKLEYYCQKNRETPEIYMDFKRAAFLLGVEEGWLRAEWEKERRKEMEEWKGKEREARAREEAGGMEWHDEEWARRRHEGYDDRTCVVM